MLTHRHSKSPSGHVHRNSVLGGRHIFVLKDGSLGAIYELNLIEHEPLDANKIVDLVDNLKSWFFLPERCTLQILFDQSHIPARDPVWNPDESSFLQPHPVSQAIYKARLEVFKSFCEGKSTLSPMKRKSLLSIRFFPDEDSKKTILRLLEHGEGLLFDTMNAITREVSEFSQILAQFNENSRVSLSRYDKYADGGLRQDVR